MEQGVGKNSAPRAFLGIVYSHVSRAERGGRLDGGVADLGTNHQRHSQLCSLHLADALAGKPRCVLSASGESPTALGNNLIRSSFNLCYGAAIAVENSDHTFSQVGSGIWECLYPVIGLVQVGWQGRADRYTYLPQIGLYVAVAWALADLTALWRRQRTILGAAAMLVIGLLSVSGWVQTSYWRDSETLFKHALAVTTNNDVAENNLGIVFLGQGKLDEAISLLQAAVDLRPDNSPAHENLAKALLQKGDVSDALIHYHKLLELQPDNIEVHNIVGTVLVQQRRIREGVDEWQKVLAIQPDNGNAMSNLAWIFATSPDDSLRDGMKAVQLAERAMQLSDRRSQ